ncbi:hypothetical protein D3C86_1955650 [compost metagenome]
MPPNLRQRISQRLRLILPQHRSHLSLAARHHHDVLSLLLQRKMNCVIGGGIAGMQGGDDINCRGQLVRRNRIGDREIQERHPVETQSLRQFL